MAPRDNAGPILTPGDRDAVPRGSFTSSRKLSSVFPVRLRRFAAANHPVRAPPIVGASGSPVERNFRWLAGCASPLSRRRENVHLEQVPGYNEKSRLAPSERADEEGSDQ
jgi:hypothetical protein